MCPTRRIPRREAGGARATGADGHLVALGADDGPFDVGSRVALVENLAEDGLVRMGGTVKELST